MKSSSPLSGQTTENQISEHDFNDGTVIEGSQEHYKGLLSRLRPYKERLEDEIGWPSEP